MRGGAVTGRMSLMKLRLPIVVFATLAPALAVANDGPRIAESDRERIFAPFTRLDDARDLDEGGSGLGLAIARGLAESLGGTLTVVDVASGAQFAATFPVVGRD